MPSTTAPAPSPPSPVACNWREAGFGVYVHWPFCQAKCPYCDFNSHVADSVDHNAWTAALVAEIGRAARLVPGREVASVFFGGGTPSLMRPATVAAVLDAVARGWPLAADAEVTLEANPTSADAARFRGYRAAGVNRLSLGVQALDDGDLQRLGRRHTADEALRALEGALDTFPRVSADVIYARQHQEAAAWQAELGRILGLGLEHLSLYQLTVEDGTAFGERLRRGRLGGLPGEDRAADLYDLTQAQCAAAGLPAYEVSNHARPGCEARHNLVYWRAGDWVGVGPGACGRITAGGRRRSSTTPRDPATWLAAAGTRGATVWDDADDHAAEYLMMGLRLSEGVSLDRLARLGRAPDPRALGDLARMGLVAVDGDRLRATPDGRRVLNAVLAEIV